MDFIKYNNARYNKNIGGFMSNEIKIISTNLNFKTNQMLRMKPNDVRIIILHHRGGRGDIESIHLQHLKNGWAGCGYHFYIRYDGKIYEGRPTSFVGSHCNGNNSKSIGICLEGNFLKEEPRPAQLTACKELVVYLKGKFKNINNVLNHNDLYKTQCPVVDLKEMIK